MKCVLCKKDVCINFEVIEEVMPMLWGRCSCGAIFHENGIDKKYFGWIYQKQWQRMADMKERFEYAQRIYVPIIEEMTFGRKFLDVGNTLPYAVNFLKDRGWITAAIDLVPGEGHIQGDFETFDIPEKFDYIQFGHCLECFHDPIRAIQKAYAMLNTNGVLFITHPSPETIFEIGLEKFGHWKFQQSHVFISQDKLEDICKRTGFDVIISRRNISPRFVMSNDLHLLLQRKD